MAQCSSPAIRTRWVLFLSTAFLFLKRCSQNPVRKWQMSDIKSAKVEKSKHVHIDVSGAEAASLHFHAGSKDTAEAIMSKLESSRALAGAPATNGASPPPPAEEPSSERPRSRAKSVHFDDAAPDVIPASDTYDTDEEAEPQAAPSHIESEDGPAAVALYDFDADGEDELSVREGESLIVLEQDGNEWWKCRNASGAEGVVPASYVEVSLIYRLRSLRLLITPFAARRWRRRASASPSPSPAPQ